jgi:hypothetical protein
MVQNLRIHNADLSAIVNAVEQQSQLKNARLAKRREINMRYLTANNDELYTVPPRVPRPESFAETWAGALQILVEELGAQPESLREGASFDSFGLDFVEVIHILSRMKSEISLEISPYTFMKECRTVRHFQILVENNFHETESPR